jgi:multiple sugar transport system permease protein
MSTTEPLHRRRRTFVSPTKVVVLVVLAATALLSLLPLYWMVATAFQTPSGAVTLPPELVPSPPSTYGFDRLFATPSLFRWTFNSLFVATVGTAAYVLVSTMAGYALAQRTFPGRRIIFTIYVASVLVPGILSIVTTYLVIVALGWTNSYLALIIPELASPFGAFLMCQALRSFPRELLDAARIDGAGEWTAFRRVVIPIALPAMAVLAVLHFQYMWNSFVWPLTVTSEEAMRTLPVGLANLQTIQSTNFPLLMAGATFAAVPMIIVFFAAQRFFLKGVTVGALKG